MSPALNLLAFVSFPSSNDFPDVDRYTARLGVLIILALRYAKDYETTYTIKAILEIDMEIDKKITINQ
jgi:hypothetical protein